MPRLTKICVKRASSDATTRSHANAMLQPAPAATPRTFAIVGLGSVCNASAQRADAAHVHERVGLPVVTGEVGAGAEPFTGAGEHQHPVFGSCRDRAERLEQLVRHLRVERIALLGTIEGDGHHSLIAVAAFDQDRLHRGEATPPR